MKKITIFFVIIALLVPNGIAEAKVFNHGSFWAHVFCSDHGIDWPLLLSILEEIIKDTPSVKYFSDGLRVVVNGTHYKIPYMTSLDEPLGTAFAVSKTHRWGGVLVSKSLAEKKAIMREIAKFWKASKPSTFDQWRQAIDSERSDYTNSHCPDPQKVPVPKWVPVPVEVKSGSALMSDGSLVRVYESKGAFFLSTRPLTQVEIESIIKFALSSSVVIGGVYLIFQSGGVAAPILLPIMAKSVLR